MRHDLGHASGRSLRELSELTDQSFSVVWNIVAQRLDVSTGMTRLTMVSAVQPGCSVPRVRRTRESRVDGRPRTGVRVRPQVRVGLGLQRLCSSACPRTLAAGKLNMRIILNEPLEPGEVAPSVGPGYAIRDHRN
jgi:hypothetical protein